MAHFDKDVIPQIEAVYATLSPTEKVVADFFIHNRRRMDFGAPNIADILHVSLASLSRFAKKIGFAGYREFIYKYKEDLREDTAQTVPDQWSMQALSSYQELLDKSYALVNERQINALSDMLSTYQRIYVYGRGSSGLAAQEMQLRFMRIGSIITAITDSDVMMMNSVLLDDTCLVIAISISGKTPAVIKALRKAKESGARTVLMTSHKSPEQDEYCDEVVLLALRENIEAGKVISPQFPILIYLDILYAHFLQHDSNHKELLHERTLDILQQDATEQEPGEQAE